VHFWGVFRTVDYTISCLMSHKGGFGAYPVPGPYQQQAILYTSIFKDKKCSFDDLSSVKQTVIVLLD
jgi:hypothetical protein